MRRPLLSAFAALCLAAPLSADDAAGLVVQARLSSPMENLKDRVGSQAAPGLSLGVNLPLEDGFAYRIIGGVDRFKEGDTPSKPGVRTAVDVSHLSVEGTYALRGEGGPYILCGLGGYSWSIKEKDALAGTLTTHRATHLGLSLGVGYQVARRFDVELRAAGGKVESGLAAGFVGVAFAYRF